MAAKFGKVAKWAAVYALLSACGGDGSEPADNPAEASPAADDAALPNPPARDAGASLPIDAGAPPSDAAQSGSLCARSGARFAGTFMGAVQGPDGGREPMLADGTFSFTLSGSAPHSISMAAFSNTTISATVTAEFLAATPNVLSGKLTQAEYRASDGRRIPITGVVMGACASSSKIVGTWSLESAAGFSGGGPWSVTETTP